MAYAAFFSTNALTFFSVFSEHVRWKESEPLLIRAQVTGIKEAPSVE